MVTICLYPAGYVILVKNIKGMLNAADNNSVINIKENLC
jgi:hypothetical protein